MCCEDSKNALLQRDFMSQFDIDKLNKMIKVFISLIKTMQLELGEINSLKITPSYEVRYSGFIQPSSSKIESFLLKDYDDERKLRECISKFQEAFNCLGILERQWFIKYYLKNEKTINMNFGNMIENQPREQVQLRWSAIIKFATCLKFHRLEIYTNDEDL